MVRFKSAKVNEFRLWGLALTMGGMALMIAGTAALVFKFPGANIISTVGLILGLLTMMGSMFIYFWAGMLSTSAVQLECPECGQVTKMIGKIDRCMYCKTSLSWEPGKTE
jgi:hypothetical protein